MSNKQKSRTGKPKLTLSAAKQQVGPVMSIDYLLEVGEEPICIVEAPPETIIDFGYEPGVCVCPNDSFPLVEIYQAYLEWSQGLSIIGFVAPPTRCFKPGETHRGKIALGTHVSAIIEDEDKHPVEIRNPLPPHFRVQMTIGYGSAALILDPQQTGPEQAVLKWQKALESNILEFKRDFCWNVD